MLREFFCFKIGVVPRLLTRENTQSFKIPRVRSDWVRASKSPRVFLWTWISGLQKGPAERGHVKKRQKLSKSVKKFFDTFRHFSLRAKNVKNRQKVSKSFSTLFDNFRAAPFFRPLLQSADWRAQAQKRVGLFTYGYVFFYVRLVFVAYGNWVGHVYLRK